MTDSSLRKVYVVDGSRTPFLKARGKIGPFTASDLAVATGRELLLRQPFVPPDVGEVIAGCMLPSENEANIARVTSLRLACGDKVPAWTVQRNCGSGMQALDNAMQDIAMGRHDIVLAGGMDAMSHAPLVLNKKMVDWLADWRMARSFVTRVKLLGQLRPSFFAPIISLICGLSDPVVGLSMGQTAENVAHLFHITREQMDEYALSSHQRLCHAQEKGYLSEITPIFDHQGNIYTKDDGVRCDSNMEKLAKLEPYFDRKFGQVTAGNSSQITDGAAFLILASAKAIKQYNLPVIGRILDVNWAALDPAYMGLGPVHAVTPMLQRNHLNLSNIDYWEINEAFAAQVLGCLKAWESREYCEKYLDLKSAFGSIDRDRLNIDGGAIALGHPIGASGARIVLHLLQVLRRKDARLGVATECIGGGQGGAMLLENVIEVSGD